MAGTVNEQKLEMKKGWLMKLTRDYSLKPGEEPDYGRLVIVKRQGNRVTLEPFFQEGDSEEEKEQKVRDSIENHAILLLYECGIKMPQEINIQESEPRMVRAVNPDKIKIPEVPQRPGLWTRFCSFLGFKWAKERVGFYDEAVNKREYAESYRAALRRKEQEREPYLEQEAKEYARKNQRKNAEAEKENLTFGKDRMAGLFAPEAAPAEDIEGKEEIENTSYQAPKGFTREECVFMAFSVCMSKDALKGITQTSSNISALSADAENNIIKNNQTMLVKNTLSWSSDGRQKGISEAVVKTRGMMGELVQEIESGKTERMAAYLQNAVESLNKMVTSISEMEKDVMVTAKEALCGILALTEREEFKNKLHLPEKEKNKAKMFVELMQHRQDFLEAKQKLVCTETVPNSPEREELLTRYMVSKRVQEDFKKQFAQVDKKADAEATQYTDNMLKEGREALEGQKLAPEEKYQREVELARKEVVLYQQKMTENLENREMMPLEKAVLASPDKVRSDYAAQVKETPEFQKMLESPMENFLEDMQAFNNGNLITRQKISLENHAPEQVKAAAKTASTQEHTAQRSGPSAG